MNIPYAKLRQSSMGTAWEGRGDEPIIVWIIWSSNWLRGSPLGRYYVNKTDCPLIALISLQKAVSGNLIFRWRNTASGVVWRHWFFSPPVFFFPCLASWETEISNLYIKGKNASRATDPCIWATHPLGGPFSVARSLFLFPQIIPGLHTPGSRAPRGKRLRNSKSWEQSGSLFSFGCLCHCLARLSEALGEHPVFARTWAEQ